jgi:hypothetical protein
MSESDDDQAPWEILREFCTVELDSVPTDICVKIRRWRHDGDIDWLAPDRWHHLEKGAELVHLDDDHQQWTDSDGRVWLFRPVRQSDFSLVCGPAVPATPPKDFPAWMRRQLRKDGLL